LHQVSRYGAERAIRALGVARMRDIKQHYIRGRYAHLPKALSDLETEGQIQKVEMKDANGSLPGNSNKCGIFRLPSFFHS